MPANLNNKSPSPLLLHKSRQATIAEELRSGFLQSVMHSQPSPRPSNWPENTAPSTKHHKSMSSQWKDASKGSNAKDPSNPQLVMPVSVVQQCFLMAKAAFLHHQAR
eukprot:15366308-Ditylum_brightwellii.AAC.2